MDDQYAYLLSGLLTRHFGLGRIARFRQVERGRQASTFEVLTAQQNEYLVHLYPASYPKERLAFMAGAINRLDENRFSLMPFLKTKKDQGETFVVAGPQNTHLLVGLNPAGSPRPAQEWTDHQRAELGLRLAWLHRLLREELPAPQSSLRAQLEDSLALPPDRLPRNLPAVPAAHLAALVAALDTADPESPLGYVHGDLHPDTILLDEDLQLRYLLDWALLAPGNPGEDLAAVFLHWCNADPALMRPIIEAYFALERPAPGSLRAALPQYLARRVIEARAARTPLAPFLPHLARVSELAALLESAQ